jgi:hypothetical protein
MPVKTLGEHFHSLAWMIPPYKNNTESCYLYIFGGSLDQALGIHPCSVKDLLNAIDCFIVFSSTCCLVAVSET